MSKSTIAADLHDDVLDRCSPAAERLWSGNTYSQGCIAPKRDKKRR